MRWPWRNLAFGMFGIVESGFQPIQSVVRTLAKLTETTLKALHMRASRLIGRGDHAGGGPSARALRRLRLWPLPSVEGVEPCLPPAR